MDVPVSLRSWFVAHFAVGVAVGAPLLFVPGLLLGALGWRSVDPVCARLAGAGLLVIGAVSWLARDEGPDVCRMVLNLNTLWAYAALFGLVAAAGQGAAPAVWALLSAFLAFAGVWTHYRIRFKQLGAQPADDEA